MRSMALYTYSLFLLREADRGPFVDDLQRAGLVRTVADEIELLGLHCTPSIQQRPEGVTVLELAPDSDTFERLLRERGDDLVSWLWTAIEEAGLLYAFIPGGGDFKYDEDGISIDTFQWTQLGELLETGTVRVVHPFMMFAARLARPCDRARTLDWGLNECRDGIGCLIGLASRTESGFEILEPGTTYPQLRKEWMQ
jgi:hypothetical protein